VRFAASVAAVVAGFIEGGSAEEKAAIKKLAEVTLLLRCIYPD
jgi:hypothetical protein